VRIVVTGASGNAGTALLRRLSTTGEHELVGLSRRRPPGEPPYGAAEWVTVDLGQAGAADELAPVFAGADAVVHLAWAIQPQRQPEILRRVNQDGTAAVVDAAIAAGVPHLVHQSSVGTYAPGPGCTVDESWPASGVPSSVYSVDKAAAERIVTRAEKHMTVTRVRPALIFQDDAASEIARYFLGPLVPRALVRRGLLRHAPFPETLAFQLVHADDLAAALELVLRARPVGAVNVAAPPAIDRAAFAEVFGGVGPPLPVAAIRAAAAAAWHARLIPTEPGWVDLAAQVPCMDTGRLEVLGWHAEHDAGAVLGGFVDALRRGQGAAGPLLFPAARRRRPA
jgi:nucleoside-diphosphate-sugar epimerase